MENSRFDWVFLNVNLPKEDCIQKLMSPGKGEGRILKRMERKTKGRRKDRGNSNIEERNKNGDWNSMT